MSIELHWAQKEAASAIGDFLQAGEKKIYVDMPTRTRKTGIYLHMLELFAQKGILPRTTIVTDRKEQIRSILNEARRYAPNLIRQGAIQAHTSKSLREASVIPPIRVMTYIGRTAAVLDGTLKPEDEQFLIEDEAQHALSELRLDTHHRNPDAFHVAFTSSPEYSQEKGLPQAGYKRAYKLTRQRAVDGELNSHIRNVVVEMENVQGSLDDISFAAGDFSPEDLEKLIRQTEVMENMGNFMAQWHSPVDPRPIYQRDGFVFCNSIADAVASEQYLNKRFGKNTCGAVWGAMSEKEQDRVLRAHEYGDIKFLASADFAVEGFGKDHHDVVINRVPTRSAVRAEQRGGRVTGFDENNPDKEAVISDLMYPAERTEQLTYGDAIKGHLFERSNHYQKQKGGRYERGEPNTMPTPIIEGLKIYATPNAIETFACKREIKRKEALSSHLRNYTDPVRKSMIRTGLLSVDMVWAEAQKFMQSGYYRRQEKSRKFDVGKNTVKSLMLGNGYFEHPEYKQYSDGAIVLAAALKTSPKALFGGLAPKLENGDVKPLAPIRYKSSELDFNNDDLDAVSGGPEVRDTYFEYDGASSDIEVPDSLMLSDDNYSVLLEEESDNLDFVEEVHGHHIIKLKKGKKHQLIAEPLLRERYERALKTGYIVKGESNHRINIIPDLRDPFDVYADKERDDAVSRVLNSLKPRKDRVLRLRFGINLDEELTLEEAGEQLGVTQARASQIESSALRNLKHPSRTRKLSSFIEGDGSGMYTGHQRQDLRLDHPSVQWREHLEHRKTLREKADQAQTRKYKALMERERSKLSPEQLAAQKAVINLAKDFRHRYENASAITVSQALEAFLDKTEERETKLRDFRNSARYDAKNIVRLIEEGYDYNWDNSQFSRHYNENYIARLREEQSTALQLIATFRASGMTVRKIEEEYRKHKDNKSKSYGTSQSKKLTP